MDFITDYLIRSFIGLVLFYLVYFAFLRKQTFFTVNRFFLIGSIFFSLLYPLIDISLFIPEVTKNFGVLLDSIQINGSYINDSISYYDIQDAKITNRSTVSIGQYHNHIASKVLPLHQNTEFDFQLMSTSVYNYAIQSDLPFYPISEFILIDTFIQDCFTNDYALN